MLQTLIRSAIAVTMALAALSAPADAPRACEPTAERPSAASPLPMHDPTIEAVLAMLRLDRTSGPIVRVQSQTCEECRTSGRRAGQKQCCEQIGGDYVCHWVRC